MGLIFRTARLYTRGTNLASAMSFPSARPCIRPVHPQSVSLRAACPRAFRARGYPRNRRHFCPGDRPPRVVPSVPDRFSLAQTRATLALPPNPWLFQRQENLTADDRATWPCPSGPSHISRRTLPPRRMSAARPRMERSAAVQHPSQRRTAPPAVFAACAAAPCGHAKQPRSRAVPASRMCSILSPTLPSPILNSNSC
jgi:hypothetical protein